MIPVGENKNIKEGFVQNAIRTKNYEILVSSIEQGVGLEKHCHIHKQFGYCFNGEFGLGIQDIHVIKSEEYYILDGEVEHYAIATTYFEALDFKYIIEDSSCDYLKIGKLKEDIINYNCDSKYVQLDQHSFYKLKCDEYTSIVIGKNDAYKAYFIVVSDCIITDNEVSISLVPRMIYEVSLEEVHTIKLKQNFAEIYIILVEQGE